MIITGKRINSIDKYLASIEGIEEFYVCVKNDVENRSKINVDINEIDDVIALVPDPIGPVAKYNADGKKVARKDLEKEERLIEHDYHLQDYQGNYHDGTCIQKRWCYPVEILLPPCEELYLDKNIIRSDLLTKDEKKRAKHIINLFLEIFGHCEVVDKALDAINTRAVKILPWEIFPQGQYPWEIIKENVDKYISNKVPQKNLITIKQRHEFLTNYKPDFVAIGKNMFNGYIIYGFKDKCLYYFESNKTNNATYVFKGEWEDASKLTKKEIILGELCYKRIIHTDNWINKIKIDLES